MKIIFTLTVAASVLSFSCSHSPKAEVTGEKTENLIRITAAQFRDEKMAFGETEKKIFTDLVRCNGNIVARPSGTARINSAVPGQVKKILCSSGQHVRSGQVLFELTGNEFIELQKDYAETASRLKRTGTEYERIKTLYSDKVGSEKEVIAAETEYNSTLASFSALKLKIQNLGLDPEKIGKGDFYQSFPVKSPISGNVSEINVSLGEYTDPQTTMALLIDNNQLQLQVAVFEKDLSGIKPGLKIRFRPTERSDYYSATLLSVGQSVNEESKNVICVAEIADLEKGNFVNNGYAEALIITRTDTVDAVPEEAVLRSGGADFILSLARKEDSSFLLRKIQVKPGRTENGYREITEPATISGILTHGAYNIVLE